MSDNLHEMRLTWDKENKLLNEDIRSLKTEGEKIRLLIDDCERKVEASEKEVGVDNKYT